VKRAIPNQNPQSGTYMIVDRLTKVRVSASTFDQLVQNVGRVRVAIGAVSGLDLRTEIENWVCEEHPEDCTGVDMTVPRKRNLMLSDVLHGTRVILDLKMKGGKLVDKAESERRGEICKNCAFNQRYSKPCTGWCNEMVTLVHEIIGHQGLPVDAFLHACSICACQNSAQIWVPLESLDVGLTDDMRAQFKGVKVTMPDGQTVSCWKQTKNVIP
jgi:hypothetical protein